ncbi:MAG: hypothetical protein SFV52_08135 [Saprospiraceae bacterium]|nr:hypothetical protein [Saprospiraceae bacterium]
MKFFHPQIQLARTAVLDQPDAYFLHVVTFCPRTSFRADGYETDRQDLPDGKFSVRIKLQQDPALPDLPYITPVVHTLALGNIDFPDGEGFFEVTVTGAVLEETFATAREVPPPTKTKTGGTGTVGTTGADADTKPILPDSLFSMF